MSDNTQNQFPTNPNLPPLGSLPPLPNLLPPLPERANWSAPVIAQPEAGNWPASIIAIEGAESLISTASITDLVMQRKHEHDSVTAEKQKSQEVRDGYARSVDYAMQKDAEEAARLLVNSGVKPTLYIRPAPNLRQRADSNYDAEQAWPIREIPFNTESEGVDGKTKVETGRQVLVITNQGKIGLLHYADGSKRPSADNGVDLSKTTLVPSNEGDVDPHLLTALTTTGDTRQEAAEIYAKWREELTVKVADLIPDTKA
jgi:hypothetical protein